MNPAERRLPFLKVLRTLDYLQIITMVLLLAIGIIFIRSTGIQVDNAESRGFFIRQLTWIAAGGGAYIMVSALDYRSLFLFQLFSFSFSPLNKNFALLNKYSL